MVGVLGMFVGWRVVLGLAGCVWSLYVWGSGDVSGFSGVCGLGLWGYRKFSKFRFRLYL